MVPGGAEVREQTFLQAQALGLHLAILSAVGLFIGGMMDAAVTLFFFSL